MYPVLFQIENYNELIFHGASIDPILDNVYFLMRAYLGWIYLMIN